MSLIAMLVGSLGMLLGSLSMLLALGMIALAMVIRSRTMGFRRVFMMFRGFVVFVSCHFISFGLLCNLGKRMHRSLVPAC
jgi:hypothetical protein